MIGGAEATELCQKGLLCCVVMMKEGRRKGRERDWCLWGFKYSEGELLADFESQIRHVPPGFRAHTSCQNGASASLFPRAARQPGPHPPASGANARHHHQHFA